MAFNRVTWRELAVALLQIFKRPRSSPPITSNQDPPDYVSRPCTPPAPQDLEPVVPYTGPDHFTSLPTEILLEIASFACADSQASYRALLLASTRLNVLVKFDCLRFVPVRLQCNSHIEDFCLFLESNPDLAPRVRYLWINTRPRMTTTSSGLFWEDGATSPSVRVAKLCTNIISLACSSPVLFYLTFALSPNSFVFKHAKLRELTLLDNSIRSVFNDIGGPHMFAQLTHLTILDTIAYDFPAKKFTSLQYFSAEVYPPSATSDTLNTWMAVLNSRVHLLLAPLPQEVRITLTIVHTKVNAKEEIRMTDGRLCVARIGRPTHFQWWADRARGGDGVWS